jgi:hypothetical protein
MSGDRIAAEQIERAPSRARRWLPVFVVVGVIAIVAGGGRLAGAAANATTAGTQELGAAVRVRPLPGWAAATPPGAPLPERSLTRGSVTLLVVAVPGWSGTPEDLAQTYLDRTLGPRLDELEIGQASSGTLASGALAVRFGYVGVADGLTIEGAATVATGATTGAIFDAFAPKGDLPWVASDVDTMIEDAEVG